MQPIAAMLRVPVKFYGLVAVLAITLGVICACEPVQGDSWQHYVAARESLTWQRFIAFADYSYHAGNPRWGQLVLAAMFHHRELAVVITPLVLIAMLLAIMTLIRARWPRPSDPADAWLFVQVLATAIATTPQFGAIWFNRPTCANYVYPLLVQLVWLIPYRCLAAAPHQSSVWRAIAIVPLGLLAGAGNEHTGIALGLAAAACTYVAWRRDRRIPAWTILGLIALAVGYLVLLTAPGQFVRYGGLAAEASPFDVIVARGLSGNLAVAGVLLAWASPMLLVVACTAGATLRTRGWLDPMSSRWIAGCLAIAAVMVATALAAPHVPARMLVAPSTLVTLALGILMVELSTLRAKARRLRIVSVVIASLALAITLAIFVVTAGEGRARLRQLDLAAAGSVVCVVPYTFSAPTPFSWGDDFRSTALSARVTRLFGLAAIDLTCR